MPPSPLPSPVDAWAVVGPRETLGYAVFHGALFADGDTAEDRAENWHGYEGRVIPVRITPIEPEERT